MATFYCSLTGAPCVEPVISRTGYVFDRAAIVQFLNANPGRCPVTGEPLTVADLYYPGAPPAASGPTGGPTPFAVPAGVVPMAPSPNTVMQQQEHQLVHQHVPLNGDLHAQQTAAVAASYAPFSGANSGAAAPAPSTAYLSMPHRSTSPIDYDQNAPPVPVGAAGSVRSHSVRSAGAASAGNGGMPAGAGSVLYVPTPSSYHASLYAVPGGTTPEFAATGAPGSPEFLPDQPMLYANNNGQYQNQAGNRVAARAESYYAQQPNRSSWHESVGGEPAVPSVPSHRNSVMMNAAIADDVALTDALAQQDHRYSAALAAPGGVSTHDRLVAQASAVSYRPWFVWLVTALQVAGLALSMVVNYNTLGSPIQTSPSFNYMIGPAPEILIQVGARFVPCMKPSTVLPASGNPPTPIACLIPPSAGGGAAVNATGANGVPVAGQYLCNWGTFCGKLAPTSSTSMANVAAAGQDSAAAKPTQWFRFILPLFLHAGVVHFVMNITFQWTAVKSLERDWGWFRIAPVYLCSGIAGFVFGGIFSEELAPSVGCSGALFGMVALLLIDLTLAWRLIHHPTRQLMRMLLVIVVTFALGLFPSIDNFAHIGGFVMGGLVGLVVMPRSLGLSCCSSRSRKRNGGMGASSSATLTNGSSSGGRQPGGKGGAKASAGMFHGYSTANLAVRGTALVLSIALFATLFSLFYKGNGDQVCSWCRYLDCLPALGQCSVGGN
ncbi:hypothetical protein H9P43_000832 [Blastocladiella emersonii ATCC 22665]|nr:hypothetical protein H9P43_000832 [Blastocladiella emersonii ATCC 22665]